MGPTKQVPLKVDGIPVGTATITEQPDGSYVIDGAVFDTHANNLKMLFNDDLHLSISGEDLPQNTNKEKN